MISYFKFTEGGSFTLDEADYAGMLHVVNGKAFTGAITTTQTKELSSKNTFSSNMILSKLNYTLPNGVTGGLPSHLSAAKVYPRDILNINLLSKLLNTLNKNNIILYSASAKYDANYFNILYRTNDSIPFVYSLSSIGVPRVNKLAKTYIPFSFSTESNIFRDRLLHSPNPQGSFFICEPLSSYTYYNNGAAALGVINSLSGITFTNGISSTLFNHKFNFFDPYQEVIYQTNFDSFSIFSIDKFTGADNVSFVDKIIISNLNTPIGLDKASYGKNYRTVLVRDSSSGIGLEIYPIRDTLLLKTLTLTEMRLDTVVAISQRFEDDLLVVLGIRRSKVVLIQYDVKDLIDKNQKIKEDDLEDVDFIGIRTAINASSVVISEAGNNFRSSLTLSNFDSDIIFINSYNIDGSISNCQMRSLTHPKLPFTNFNSFNVINLEKNDIIDKIASNIESYDVSLSNIVPKLLDIKVVPYGSNLNTIVVSDSYIMTDTHSLIKHLISPFTSLSYDSPYISDSSIGLIINDIIRSLLKDVLLLYRRFNQAPRQNINLPTLLPEIDIDDLQIYGNESINMVTLNRSLDRIFELQLLVANSISLE